jgi:hypothetical protein
MHVGLASCTEARLAAWYSTDVMNMHLLPMLGLQAKLYVWRLSSVRTLHLKSWKGEILPVLEALQVTKQYGRDV